jgi:hypothetical protein
MIEKVVGTSDTSQLMIATHDPLTIAGLVRSQVLIFRQEDCRATAAAPHVDPRGLGVQGVLTRLFGLPTTLDPQTQGKLDRRNALYRQAERTPNEDSELTGLSFELGNMGFLTAARDPDYELFLRAMGGQHRETERTLSPQQIDKINLAAEKILEGLLQKETAG